MAHINLHQFMYPPIFDERNTLMQLYLIKKEIQQNLVKEINANLLLKQQLNLQLQSPSTYEKSQSPQPSQVSIDIIQSSFESQEITRRKKKNKKLKKVKNDTKNVPKNYGKAIINFIQQREELVSRFLKNSGKDYETFLKSLKLKKKNLNSIAELRGLWLEESFEYAKQMRTLSMYFLKRFSLEYIFGSRISNHDGHIKYRKRLIDVLRTPNQFTYIKS